MTKQELAQQIFDRFNEVDRMVSLKDMEQSVQVLLNTMLRSLSRKERIEIRGFGAFDITERKARTGRNPKTGIAVPISARRVVTFHASQKLKGMVEHYYDKKRK